MKLALALTAGTASAFVAPSSAPAAKTQLAAAPVTEWAGATAPFGFFDPLGLSKDVDAGRLAFYREAEIKHGRVRYGVRLPTHLDSATPHAINVSSTQVAMLAFTGALVQSYGMHFDGKLNGMFYEKGVNPFEVSFQSPS